MQSDTISLFDYTFSSSDLVISAALLLVLAAVLLAFTRRSKIALQSSMVTEELMVYLSRIADALEIQAARTPERLVAEITAALKETTNLSPPTLSNDPEAVRFPSYIGKTPPEP